MGPPLIALADPWYSAAGWREWNMSQSGCMNSPKKILLNATAAMWMVCDVGSLGKKSSDALTTAVCFELFHSTTHHIRVPKSYHIHPLITYKAKMATIIKVKRETYQ